MPHSQPLWTPKHAEHTAMSRFIAHAGNVLGQPFASYSDLHAWSVRDPDMFWRMFLDFSGISYEGDASPVFTGDAMPGTRFFPEVRLSFAANLLRHDGDGIALVSISESRATRRTTWRTLRARVASVRAGLQAQGVQPGDRVAGFLPNCEEAVVAMLATASLGAIWSSCSPDFGLQGVLDRFGQIQPRVLFAVNGYIYNGRVFDCRERLAQFLEAIPSIERLVIVPHRPDLGVVLAEQSSRSVTWENFAQAADVIEFPLFAFNHPLYILYSSGTTGVPKCIVHGAGGTLLQHVKELTLHSDLRAGDHIVYFTTCGWMMWNWLVSSLFVGATVTLFDGSPSHPNLDHLWQLAAEERWTHFGTSAKYLASCRDKVQPKRFDLAPLRVLLSTGSPLLPDDFDWVYANVKTDVQLSSISGGTDIISCFMLGNPCLPVYRGEIQCLGLGMDVAALGEDLQPVERSKGELVCRKPAPSMPIGFWQDEAGSKYRKAYFHTIDNIWFHGDYIEMTGSQGSAGGVIVHGRSDATLNPGGVRIGTAEIYRVVETRADIDDSIVVGQREAGDERVLLFVKLAAGTSWSEQIAQDLKAAIRTQTSPRHVPHLVAPVPDIPYTLSGKKVELAVREILEGREPKNKAALANPQALEAFRNFVRLGA